MSYCTNCGTKNAPTSKYCSNCGSALAATQSAVGEARKPESEKESWEGFIHKCPSCGEPIRAFATHCTACGHEFRDSNASSSTRTLGELLRKASTSEEKEMLIRSFPIPNTREDIYEFFILASSNITDDELSDAWTAKCQQALQKASLTFSNSQEYEYLSDMHKEMVRQHAKHSAVASIQKNPGAFVVIIGIAMTLVGFFAGSASNDSDSPFYMMAMIGMTVAIWGVIALLISKENRSE